MANQPPLDPYLGLHNKANDKTSVGDAHWKRGIINQIYPNQGIADVQLVGSHSTILKAIYLGSGIDANSVKIGDRCLVWMFSEQNPDDAFILAIYGRILSSPNKVNFGSAYIPLNSSHYAVAHGLGVTPNIVTFSGILGAGAGVVDQVYISGTNPQQDSINFYVDSIGSARVIYWYAAYIAP